MRSLFTFTAMGILLGTASFAHNGNRVDIEADLSISTAGKVHYTFQLVDEKLRKPVADSDLAVVHEKKLHMMAFDSGLKEFTHVHPTYKDGIWSANLELPVRGNYKVWIQGQLKSGEEFTTGESLKITGGKPANPVPASLEPVKKGSEGNSDVALSYGTLHAGKMVMIDIVFSRNDGSKFELTPYLGAFAHIAATPLDSSALIHVHPMDGDKPGTGMIHASFPKAGDYRLWVQFVDAGKMRVVPLAVRVVE